jgi:hypothetical protein
MCVQQLPELGGRHVQDRRARRLSGARAVDQRTDSAELVDAPFDECIGDVWISGGARVTHSATTDAVDGVVDGIGVTSIDHDSEPLRGKQFGDRQPDAAGPADDDRAGQLGSS